MPSPLYVKMSTTAVPILKFVGTISLGLLTVSQAPATSSSLRIPKQTFANLASSSQGVSYTTATQSIPALLTLPSADAAQSTIDSHKKSTSKHLSTLFALTVASYSTAFALAPPRGGRHPYLLWTSLAASIGWGAAEWLLRTDAANVRKAAAELARKQQEREQERQIDESYVDAGTSSVADLRGESKEEMNGEEVRKSMEQWRIAEIVRTGATGVAFCMAVLGIWGDGSGLRYALRA